MRMLVSGGTGILSEVYGLVLSNLAFLPKENFSV